MDKKAKQKKSGESLEGFLAKKPHYTREEILDGLRDKTDRF